jgi:hypothetical protein
MANLPKFIVTNFWWIIAASVAIKIGAYFISPPGNATMGYHVGSLLREFVVYGVILALVAFIVAKLIKSKPHLFKVVFASLLLLACLLDIPVALLEKQTTEAVTRLVGKYACFEALMKYEGNPSYEKTSSYYLNTYYWKTRAQFVECARETLPEYIGVDDRTVYAQIISKYPVYEKQIEENYIREKTSFTDGEKYFALSYCYVTGYDGTPKDIGKAVQLCQKAASGYTYHSRAREILKKAGFSWTD